jgi:hypothetical protein
MTDMTPSTRSLGLPEDTRRIWRDERTGMITIRPLTGLGPKGHLPVGYITPDDTIVTERHASLTEKELHFVALFHTGPAKSVDDLTSDELTRLRANGTCRWCEIPHGLPHAASCRHAGKRVGDSVRDTGLLGSGRLSR